MSPHLVDCLAGLCYHLLHQGRLLDLWGLAHQAGVGHTHNTLPVRHTNQLTLCQQRVQLNLQSAGNSKEATRGVESCMVAGAAAPRRYHAGCWLQVVSTSGAVGLNLDATTTVPCGPDPVFQYLLLHRNPPFHPHTHTHLVNHRLVLCCCQDLLHLRQAGI